MQFKAKDILRILNIKYRRYDYLMMKIGIQPEVENPGTGHSHLYSFKNLLQFAFAHYALESGMRPRDVKAVLASVDLTYPNEIYDSQNYTKYMLYYMAYPPSVAGEGFVLSFPLSKEDEEVLENRLEYATIYTVINLSEIKKRVLEAIR